MTARRISAPDPQHWRRVWAVITVCAGAGLTWASLSLPDGDVRFVPFTATLALMWATGALLAGGAPISVQPVRTRAVIAGVLLCASFVAGGVAVGYIPALRQAVEAVLNHSSSAPLALIAVLTALTGAAEELFFRGALYSLLSWRPAIVSTGVYAVTIVPTGNVMLIFASLLVGAVTAYQRSITDSVFIPVMTHALWGLTMLLVLPALLR